MAESWLDPAEILGLKETVDTTQMEVPEGLFADESTDEINDVVDTPQMEVPEGLFDEINYVVDTGDNDASEFSKGLRRQWNNMQGLTGDALEVYGTLTDNQKLIDYGKAVSVKNKLEAQAVGDPKVSKVEEVTTETLGSFVANSIGQAVPSLGIMGTSALAGNLVSQFVPYLRALKYGKAAVTALGPLLTGTTLATGEAASTQKDLAETTEIPDAMQALLTGIKAGSLDALTLVPILKGFQMKGGVVKNIKEIQEVFGVSKNVALEAVSKIPNILKVAAQTGAVEAAVEGVQEYILVADAEKVTGVTLDPEEKKSLLLNAAVQGGIGGGSIALGTQTVANIVNSTQGPSGLKLNNVSEGTAIKYPNFSTFQEEVTEVDKQKITDNYGVVFPEGITNETDFLKLREAEVDNIVDKPARATLEEVYKKGGRPTNVNYYKKGDEIVAYKYKDKDGIFKTTIEPIDVSFLTRYKKNFGVGWDALTNITVGKSVTFLDDLARRSSTANEFRKTLAYNDDGRGKKEIQNATIDEAKILEMGKHSVKVEKAMQILSKFFRLPFTSKITQKNIRQLYQAIDNPNQKQFPAPVLQAAKLFREGYNDLYKYVTEAKYIRGDLKGQTIPFGTGFIKNYAPIMIKKNKLKSDSKFRKAFTDMLEKNNFEQREQIIADIIEDDGFLNLPPLSVDPTKKAGSLDYKRRLKDIPKEELAPFENSNPIDAYQRYRTAVIDRVEFAKRYGIKSEIVKADIEKIKEEAAEMGQPLTVGEGKRINSILNALQKQYNPITNTFLRKLNAALITYGYILTLPFATISSLSEPFLVLSRGGANATIILKSLFSGVKGIIRNTFPRFPRDEFDRAVADIGLGLEASVLERQAAAFGGGQETNKITEKFFRYTFLSQFTRWNRLLANASGRNMVLSHAEFLSNNMKEGATVESLPQKGRFKVYAEQLRELGVNPNDAVAFVRSEAYKNKNVEQYKATPLYQEQVRLAGARYVNEVVMNPRAVTRPMWMSDPRLAIFGQLKGFQVTFSNTVLKRWIKEVFQGGFYVNVPNAGKLFAVGAIMVIAASLGNEFRDFLKYGIKGNPRNKDETLFQKFNRAFERTGFLGPLQFLKDAAQAEQFGSGPVESLMGPIVTRLVSYLEGIAQLMDQGEKEKLLREIIKSIPIVASSPKIRDRFYEALGVESTFGKTTSDFGKF